MQSHDASDLTQWLLATAQGDHASFAKVYEATSAHLFGVALRMLGNEAAAQDVLQESYVNIWKNASQFRTPVNGQSLSPMTWLIAIVRNKSLDALRQTTRRKEDEFIAEGDGDDRIPTPVSDVAPSALESLTQATEQLQIDSCMGSLPAAQRQALALCYYQGLSHTEASEQMGSPIGSVKAWVRRGLNQLKNCLAQASIVAA